jgi:hypothetical protein
LESIEVVCSEVLQLSNVSGDSDDCLNVLELIEDLGNRVKQKIYENDSLSSNDDQFQVQVNTNLVQATQEIVNQTEEQHNIDDENNSNDNECKCPYEDCV